MAFCPEEEFIIFAQHVARGFGEVHERRSGILVEAIHIKISGGCAGEQFARVQPQEPQHTAGSPGMTIDKILHVVNLPVDDRPRLPMTAQHPIVLVPNVLPRVLLLLLTKEEGEEPEQPHRDRRRQEHNDKDGHLFAPRLLGGGAVAADEHVGDEEGEETGKGRPEPTTAGHLLLGDLELRGRIRADEGNSLLGRHGRSRRGRSCGGGLLLLLLPRRSLLGLHLSLNIPDGLGDRDVTSAGVADRRPLVHLPNATQAGILRRHGSGSSVGRGRADHPGSHRGARPEAVVVDLHVGAGAELVLEGGLVAAMDGKAVRPDQGCRRQWRRRLGVLKVDPSVGAYLCAHILVDGPQRRRRGHGSRLLAGPGAVRRRHLLLHLSVFGLYPLLLLLDLLEFLAGVLVGRGQIPHEAHLLLDEGNQGRRGGGLGPVRDRRDGGAFVVGVGAGRDGLGRGAAGRGSVARGLGDHDVRVLWLLNAAAADRLFVSSEPGWARLTSGPISLCSWFRIRNGSVSTFSCQLRRVAVVLMEIRHRL
mmetsp:Transcript_5847/g.16871  ORF Transcript_5847/g.16871 Transcript_5847/m.16871 type:complete len:532 (+) Transcript_5847:2414-4009(+)